MKKLIVILIVFVVGQNFYGQTLSKTWQTVGNSPNSVIIFDSIYQCVTICYDIEENAQCKKKEKRITYKRKTNLIYMKWYNNQNFCCWTKDKYIFSIDKLTNDSLTLTMLKSTFSGMEELLGVDSINIPIEFTAIEEGCPPLE